MGKKRTVEYALSIKQPWAALLVHGLKAIEIRRWSTDRRGRILIHAARTPDDRDHGWNFLDDEVKKTAQLRGGIIGAAMLTGCTTYRRRKTFVADQPLHLNDPDWFLPPCMYGFIFTDPERLPFRRCPGNVRFFPVDDNNSRQGK